MKQNEPERLFIQAVAALQPETTTKNNALDALNQWLWGCEQQLLEIKIAHPGLTRRHLLVHSVQQLETYSQQSIVQWQQAKQNLIPVLELADFFADKTMLLVFGKFNAGKSSFCNWLAQRFSAHQQSVQHFVLDQGQIRFHDQSFQEGSTETTAHIQGVVLADRLVLLDTPGLHSMTADNAELTQLFIESADGVLWLSSSTSPGQTQELSELAQELRRGKALLPIITRSDYLDEIVVGTEIKKQLCHKSVENRALQEADVWQRAQDKLQQMELAPDLVQAPLSISIHYARENGQSEQALEQAGLHRLYAALLAMIKPVLVYKSNKTVAIEQHFLEEQVLPIVVVLQERLLTLAQQLEHEQQQVAVQLQQMVEELWRQIMATVPAVLERYTDQAQGKILLAQALRQIANDQLRSYVDAELGMYKIDLEEVLLQESGWDHLERMSLVAEHYEKNYLALESRVLGRLEQCAADLLKQIELAIQLSVNSLHSHEGQLHRLRIQYEQFVQPSPVP